MTGKTGVIDLQKLWVTIFLILFLTMVSAVDVESYDDQLPNENIDQSQLNSDQIQLIQRVASLENKIDNTASKEDLTNAVEFLYVEITTQFQNKTDFLILAGSLILLCVAVLMWGFFFILKSMRRI